MRDEGQRGRTGRGAAADIAPAVGLDLLDVADSSGVGFWRWTIAGGHVAWSSALYEIFGVSRDDFEPSADGYFERIHPEDVVTAQSTIEQALLHGRPWRTRYRIRRDDGTVRWLDTAGLVLETGAGGIPAVIGGMCRDVTREEEQLRQLRDQRRELEALARRVVETQEGERRELALALHDEIGQQLTALQLLLRRHAGSCDDGALEVALEQCRELHASVRELAVDLRPAMLEDLGLAGALRWLVDRLDRAADVHVRVGAAGLPAARFPEATELAAFRIAQEAVTNAVRYSAGTTVSVSGVVEGDTLVVEVEDDGVGFTPYDDPGHTGLSGMRERARSVGGRLDVRSEIGAGATVVARLPLLPPVRTDRWAEVS